MKIRYRQAGENVNKLLSHVKTSNDGYKALGFAVITEATEDHRRAFYDEDEHEMQKIERFLRSDLCKTLSGGIDGDYIIKRLREEEMRRNKNESGQF